MSDQSVKETNQTVPASHRRAARGEAALSLLLCGAGYFLQRSYLAGVLSVLAEALAILLFRVWGLDAIRGLITLGETEMRDHSLIMMVYGILAIIVFAGFLIFWIGTVASTYRNGLKIRSASYTPIRLKERTGEWLHEHAHVLFLAPGVVAIAAVILLPLVFSICLSFTDYDAAHQPPAHILNWVGLKNYQDLLVLGQYAKTYFGILGWTAVWAVCSSVLPYALGITIAILLNNPRLHGRKVFKFIYILPWAIPGYITLLVLQSMFDTGYGFINQILGLFGVDNIRWLTSVTPARIALIIVSIWTGFSYPMMLSENIIRNISKDVYEAAVLDGASSIQIFFRITLPLLMHSISPIFIMSVAGAFNNFNTIYLITGGGPLNLDYQSAGSTDILITWLFKLTITNNKYNYGAAISTVLFILIATFSIINLRKTRAFSEEDMLA
ncbi:MAG: sugar ABC transporter permease [Clostridia bacterium]|nr:sugar ABC transporter permease [Clostridia bacterium]